MVAYGKGSYVYDTSGKQYIDGSGSPAIFSVGHGNEEVNEAIKAQLDQIAHGYRYNFLSEPLVALTELIGEQCGGGLRQMMFVSSGSEAVESCLKIAMQYHFANGEPTRKRFIARDRSYHGNTLGALSVSGFKQRRVPFEGGLVDASFVSAANSYRPPEGVAPAEIADFCAAELEAEILRVGAENVSAFVFEPLVGAAGGVVPAPLGYAQKMAEVCRRYGVLLIADEVMCGSGRTGTWRALAYDGVEPDLMTVAKGLAGGYIPLGAAIYQNYIHEKIMADNGQLLTGHTFSAHTTACAAGLAVQQLILRENLLAKVAADGAWFQEQLSEALGEHPHVGDIRGRGFFVGVEYVRDRGEKRPFDPSHQLFLRLRAQALENGLICYPTGGNVDGEQGDVVILAPPYNATRHELSEIVAKLTKSTEEVFATLN